MKKISVAILVSGLFVLCTSFTNILVNYDLKPENISEITTPNDTVNQLIFYINGNNPKLEMLDHIKEYLANTFPEKTIINPKGISLQEIKSATVIYSDSVKYFVAIETINGLYISIQDRQGNPMDLGEIFNKKSNNGYANYDYFIITPNDIRIHVWNFKNNEETTGVIPTIVNEDYYHLHINDKGKISKVDRPKNIVDYYCIIPDSYFCHFVEVMQCSLLDLKNGNDWYCLNKSKAYKLIIDIKNGYVELISKMAQFNANGVAYFVLTNSAGGTCESFLYHNFLTYDVNTNQFNSISDSDILPEINKLELFEKPDLIHERFNEDQIQLDFIPPRYGTIMKLEPYLTECGIEDENLLNTIKQTKPIGLKWNRELAKFEQVDLN